MLDLFTVTTSQEVQKPTRGKKAGVVVAMIVQVLALTSLLTLGHIGLDYEDEIGTSEVLAMVYLLALVIGIWLSVRNRRWWLFNLQMLLLVSAMVSAVGPW